MSIIYLYFFLEIINIKLFFWPTVVSNRDFLLFCNNNKNTVKNISFKSKKLTNLKLCESYIISSILVNRIEYPNVDKNIIFYCHGNSWCIGKLYYSSSIVMLSKLKNTTIFMFDYRGYGNTKGFISENNMYEDALNAWNFLTQKLNVSENNIIIYGKSLGASVATHLLAYLVKNKKKIPKALFLDSPFVTLKSTVGKLLYGLDNFVTLKFNNLDNLLIINNILPIYLLHSKDDQLVKYSESLELQKKINSTIIDIMGSHKHPKYNDNVVNIIQSIINK